MRFAWSATGPTASPQKVEGQHLVAIFGGKVKLPEKLLQQGTHSWPLKYGLGHPTEKPPGWRRGDAENQGPIRDELSHLPSAALWE